MDTHFQDTGDFRNRFDDKAVEALDIHPLVLALLQVQLILGVLAQQVSHLLIVDLQEAGPHKELLLL